MVVVVPTDRSVETLRGLHLCHGTISSRSMRVRMTLAEKDPDWTGHHLDLKRKEDISDAHFGINPDGLGHIESNDIVDYLDRTFPDPPLRAADEAELLDWLRLAAAIHVPAVKPYVYATVIAPKVKKTPREEAAHTRLQKNAEQRDFHARHAGGKRFETEDFLRARARLDEVFGQLEATLAGRAWIMGERFGLADIAWIPLHFVLKGCGYPFGDYPEITRWAAACAERPSYPQGIRQWCPEFAKA